MWPFKCKCPAKWLCVVKDETIEPQKIRTEIYAKEQSIYVTYHLYCCLCNKRHNVKYCRTNVIELK